MVGYGDVCCVLGNKIVILRLKMLTLVMCRKRLILTLICAFASVVAMAQSSGGATLRLVEPDDEHLEVRFSVGEMSFGACGNGWSMLLAEGLHTGNSVAGTPQLPAGSTLIKLPRGSRLAVDSFSVVADTIFSPLLVPYTGPTVKEGDVPAPMPLTEVYTSKAFFALGEDVVVEDLGVMRNEQWFRLRVNPYAYCAATGQLRRVLSLVATLSVHRAQVAKSAAGVPEHYAIVSRPQFREVLQPFVEHKQREGYRVTEVYVDTNSRTRVKAAIAPLFANVSAVAPPPSYILLVGDAAQLQAFVSTNHPVGFEDHITDLYYAEHTGDYLPDAAIGRWPVNDTAQLRAVMEKTMRYEQGIDLDTAMLRRVLLLAGYERTDPAPLTTNGQVNYLKRELKQTWSGIDTVCWYNPQSGSQRADILRQIERGASLLSYTAHCSTSGWTLPSISFSSIDTLGCTQPMIYVNNCCRSNSFGGTCFGEQLLRKPVGGAVGVIGATGYTLWDEDYYWAVGPKYPFAEEPLFDSATVGSFDRWIGRMHGQQVRTLADMLYAGNEAVSAFGSPYDSFYWETYCLFGDPSLVPFIVDARPMSVSIPDTVLQSMTGLRVSCPKGVRVAASQGGRLLAVATADSSGSAQLDFVSSIDTGSVVLTFVDYRPSGGTSMRPFQYLPYMVSVPVAAAEGEPMLHVVATVNDSSVVVRLFNGSVDTLDNIVVTAQVQPVLTDTVTRVDFDTVRLSMLAPGRDTSAVLPYAVVSRGTQQWWQAKVRVMTDGIERSVLVNGAIARPCPTVALQLVDRQTSPLKRLVVGQPMWLKIATDGVVDSLAAVVTLIPSADSVVSHDTMTLLPQADTLTNLLIATTLRGDGCVVRERKYVVAGRGEDSFEQRFASYPWDVSSIRPWRIDSTGSRSGRMCARSATIGPRQTSDLSLTIDVMHDDSLSFYAKTSSEQPYDKLTFCIDGLQQLSQSGQTDWQYHRYSISRGRHTLRWRYEKDDTRDGGLDCAWIDDVVLPLALWDSLYGWFDTVAVNLSLPMVAVDMSKLSVSPTVAKDVVRVESACPTEARIVDANGRTVKVMTLRAKEPYHVNVSDMPIGVYWIVTPEATRQFVVIK